MLTTVQPIVNDLCKTEVGETWTVLEGAVDAVEATRIGTTFNTPNGQP